MTAATIIVLATLDTKGPEADYLRDQIEQRGDRALVVDVGVVGRPRGRADVARQEVARAGGTTLSALLDHPTREKAAPVMAVGATAIVRGLIAEGRAQAILAMGGTQGTTLCSAVMRALPFGFPKLLVSTIASGNVAPWVDVKDITMMFSVTDIMGLNPFTRRILANAAAAAAGMAHVDVPITTGRGPLIAVTTVGITTPGAMVAVEVLERSGFETVVFHAIGTGGRAMEGMMNDGIVGAVLDYSIIEVSNDMHHALLAGGPDRLSTAGKLGLPQVICPGAVEVLVFNEPETVPTRFSGRALVRHSPQITDVRLQREEMIDVAREVGRRLAATRSPAVFLIPTKGFDSYAIAGEPLHDLEADAAFVEELKRCLPPSVRLEEHPWDINDPRFARLAAETLIGLVRAGQPQGH